MADIEPDVTEIDDFTFEVYWKGDLLGYVKDVDPSGVDLVTKEKKIGHFGDVIVDRVIKGATGNVKTTLHQAKLKVVKKLCPWWTTGPVPLVPSTIGFSELEHSDVLLLHPFGLALTEKDDDLTFVKAFPRFTLPKAAGDWRELPVMFNIYPDPEQLAGKTMVTHYWGAPPVA